jgi:hypothetical protein
MTMTIHVPSPMTVGCAVRTANLIGAHGAPYEGQP